MRINKVTLRVSTDNEYSVDFSHPIKNKGRVRRKLKTDFATAEKIQKGLEYLISDELFYNEDSKDFAREALMKEGIYKHDKNNIVDTIFDIFYKDINTKENTIDDYLNANFPLPDESPRVLLIGNYGTGKSFAIKRFIDFDEDINFPFTDTSRSTTYKTEYILKQPSKSFYKFFASFYSYNDIKQKIQDCIYKSLDTKLNLLFNSNDSPLDHDGFNSHEEEILINSFNSASDNSFDLRSILGNYYKSNSGEKHREMGNNQIVFWESVYEALTEICKDILGDNQNYNYDETEIEFIKYKFNEHVFYAYEDENSNYNKLINYIMKEITTSIENCIHNLKSLHCIKDIEIKYEIDNSETKWVNSIYCYVVDYKGTEFEKFIRLFTSHKRTYFGSLLTPLINLMRMEVPYNRNIHSEFHSKSLVLIDTIGINPCADLSSSIENSTSFNFDKIDIVLVMDDSRTSISCSTQNVLKHLFHRVNTSKIYLMYSFFNELVKSEFIEDKMDMECLIHNKIAYLHRIQSNNIYNLLENNPRNRNSIIKSLQKKTYFIGTLKDNYTQLNRFLFDLFNYYSMANNYLLVNKKESKKPLLEYDFKKLSLIFFNEIQNKYLHEQTNIYLRNCPHHRTTEALTLRLSRGETSVYGDKILKPVDDLYAIIIDRLSTFILSPRSINFYSLNKDLDGSDKVLERLKEMITEKLSKLCISKFTTPLLKNMWKNLYMQNNIGADYRRRVGIIDTMNYILPSIDVYLNDTSKENWIDKIENIILTSIEELEEIMEIEKNSNMV